MGPVRGALRAVTLACVPASEHLDADGWARWEAIVADALSQRPASMRRQLRLFIGVLGLLARLRYARGLERLDPVRLRTLLEALERAPLLLLRRGTWGVRTLAFMGYYGQPATRAVLGYRAGARGWEERGGSQGPWPERAGAAPAEEVPHA